MWPANTHNQGSGQRHTHTKTCLNHLSPLTCFSPAGLFMQDLEVWGKLSPRTHTADIFSATCPFSPCIPSRKWSLQACNSYKQALLIVKGSPQYETGKQNKAKQDRAKIFRVDVNSVSCLCELEVFFRSNITLYSSEQQWQYIYTYRLWRVFCQIMNPLFKIWPNRKLKTGSHSHHQPIW